MLSSSDSSKDNIIKRYPTGGNAKALFLGNIILKLKVKDDQSDIQSE